MATTYETSTTVYDLKQRAMSLTLGIACTVPLTTASALAYVPSPQAMTAQPHATSGAWSHAMTSTTNVHASAATAAGGQTAASAFQTMTNGGTTTLVHSLGQIQHAQGAMNLNGASSGTLNLASSKLNFLAGNLGNFQTLTINVGGRQETVNLNTRLTAAELVAVQQVLVDGVQSIKIGANGAANGGQILLNSSMLNALDASVGGSLNSLTVAHGVQVVDNVSTLALAGNLVNFGSIFTASGTANATDAITANNVVNAHGGTISSYTGGGNLYGADLNLTGLASVTNSGTISGNGTVNISTPVLNNAGLISSANGNVNLGNAGGFTLNGAGGTVQAANGNVNFNTTNANINVNNGNLISQQVNFNAGKGDVNANLDQVSGVVNATACNVHVFANTADFKMGNVDASGDPLFVNAGGDFDLGTAVSASGAPLTVIASGNINSKTNTTINTSSATGDGGAVTLIAGAKVTGSTGTGAKVTGASTTGGTIDLGGIVSGSGGTVSAINTAATGGTGNGGNVQLIAYAGKTAGSGAVVSNTTTITTSSKTATAGNVTVIAGSKTGTAINTGTIVALGAGVTPGGVVTASASTPAITVTTKGQTGVSFDGTGLQTFNVFSPAKTANTGGIVMGNVDASGGLNVSTGASAAVTNNKTGLTLGNVAVGKTGTFTATDSAGDITVNGVITGGTATLTATGANGITATAAGASINSTTLNLQTGSKDANVTTDVANLAFTSAGGNIIVNQTTAKNSPLALNLSGQELTGSGNLTVNSTGQINVNGLVSITGDTITLNATGKGGIAVNNLMTAGTATSQINLSNVGTGKLTEAKGVVVSANTVNITSNSSYGTKAAPFLTSEVGSGATLIVETPNTKATVYVSDSSPNAVNFIGPPSVASGGGSLFLTSSSPALTITEAAYINVSVTDTSTVPTAKGIILAGSNLGSSTGVFTATSSTNIEGGGSVLGKTVTLNGTKGIGQNTQVAVSTPTLTLTSSQGGVSVTDNLAVTVNGSSSNNPAFTFDVTDTGAGDAKTGNSLTVGKAITGGNISLTTAGLTPGNILVAGAVGNSATSSVTVISANNLATKGAVNAQMIGLQADGASLTIGGAVGTLNSQVTVVESSKSGLLTVGGVVGGTSITMDSLGTIVTTKAINGLDASSAVSLTASGGTATTNAITIGGAITGTSISLSTGNNAGGIAVNANVGQLGISDSVSITAGTNKAANTGAISGKGVIAGNNVDLEATTSIGSTKTSAVTSAYNLDINNTIGVSVPVVLTQKGNLSLNTVNATSFTLKETGNLNISSIVTAPVMNLTVSGLTTVSGALTDGGTAGTFSLTSGAGLTTYGSSVIFFAGATPATIKVTGAANFNGIIASADAVNLTTSGLLTLGATSVTQNKADNFTSSGGIILGGTLGNGSDVFNITTTGNLQIGFPNQSTLVTGTGSLTGATIANYGQTSGSLTFNSTGAGTANLPAFANYGTIGQTGNVNTIVLNVSKGSIVTGTAGSIDAANLSLVSGGNAAVNLSGTGTSNLTAATVKGALVIGAGTGDVVLGTATAGSITSGSLAVNFAGANNNTKTLTLNSITTKTGDLNVASNAQALTVGVGATLSTLAGNISLQNSSNLASATILFSANSTVHGSGAKTNLNQGNVYIFMGPAGYVATKGTVPTVPPVAITETIAGQLTFGSTTNPTGTITVGNGDSLQSLSRLLSFNNNGLASTAISLGNNVTITADPPETSAPSITVMSNAAAQAVSTSPIVSNAAATGALNVLNTTNAASNAVSFNPSTLTLTTGQSVLTPGFLSTNADIAQVEGMVDDMSGADGGKPSTVLKKGSSNQSLTGGVSNNVRQQLNRGPLLLSPEQNTVVETPFGSVNVAANSMTLIIASDSGLSVFNLHDNHRNAVVINANGSHVAVMPGRSAVIAGSAVKSFEEANQVPYIGYRRVASKGLGQNNRVFEAEFDIITMLRGLPAVRQLVNSDSAKQRASVASVMKTAAILAQLGAGGEQFALYLTPSLTACALSPDHK